MKLSKMAFLCRTIDINPSKGTPTLFAMSERVVYMLHVTTQIAPINVIHERGGLDYPGEFDCEACPVGRDFDCVGCPKCRAGGAVL